MPHGPSRPARRLAHALVVAAACVSLVAAAAAVAGTVPPEVNPSEADADRDDGSVATPAAVVEILPVHGYVDPPVAAAIAGLVDRSEERGSDLVVVQLDSAGAVAADPRAVASRIRSSDVPVAVFVGPLVAGAEARGGAALVALSAAVVAMADDATIGPIGSERIGDPTTPTSTRAFVADALGIASTEPALDDLIDPDGPGWTRDDLAAAVAGSTTAPVVLDAAGFEPLLVDLDGREVATGSGTEVLRLRGDEVTVRLHDLGLLRRLLHGATTPEFVYLLFVAGSALLLFEVFQPGFGVAGLAGVVTLAVGVFGVTVLPVAPWAVALVVLGLVLYAVDVAIAGFGPVTLAATGTFAAGSWWFYAADAVRLPAWLVVATTVAAVVYFVVVMTSVLRAQAGPGEEVTGSLVGRAGTVRSVLNPEGHVFVDGALWRARWGGSSRGAKVGTPIQVVGVDGPLLVVDEHRRGDPPMVASEPAGVDDRSL